MRRPVAFTPEQIVRYLRMRELVRRLTKDYLSRRIESYGLGRLL